MKKKLVFFFILAVVTSIAIIFLMQNFSSNFADKENNPSNHLSYSSVLLSIRDINAVSPLKRRNAIQKIHQYKVLEGIEPLLSLLMNESTSIEDSRLIAKALYDITDTKIIFYTLKVLKEQYQNKDNEKAHSTKILLSGIQVYKMILILTMINHNDFINYHYDLSILEKIIQNSNNQITSLIFTIAKNIGYKNLFSQIKELYGKNAVLNILAVQALSAITYYHSEYKNQTFKFILSKINNIESHEDVQGVLYSVLYKVQANIKELTAEETLLIKNLASLGAKNIELALISEYKLLNSNIIQNYLTVIHFFLKSDIQNLIKEKIIYLLVIKKWGSLINKDILYNIINNRYSKKVSEDLVHWSLLALGQSVQQKQDIDLLVRLLYDKKYSDSILDVFRMNISSTKKQFFENEVSKIRDILYSNPHLLYKGIPLLVQMKHTEQILNIMKHYGSINIVSIVLNSLSDIFMTKKDFTMLTKCLIEYSWNNTKNSILLQKIKVV